PAAAGAAAAGADSGCASARHGLPSGDVFRQGSRCEKEKQGSRPRGPEKCANLVVAVSLAPQGQPWRRVMGLNADRTPREWYQEAVRCYIEGHQACASCGAKHCVFQSRWGQRLEYYCSACDFSTCFDGQTGRYFAVIGDGRQLGDSLFGGDPLEQAA